MYRATERGLIGIACGAVAALAGFAAQAQTIGDYSRSQRAVLQAEMSKNNAKAMAAAGNASAAPARPASAPPSASTAQDTPPAVAPRRGDGELTLVGVVALSSRAMAELGYQGETHLLQQGDTVPGTQWVVSSIAPERVVLKAGKSRTKSLAVQAGGR
jgi:type IV pilus biogenesis protein PilP